MAESDDCIERRLAETDAAMIEGDGNPHGSTLPLLRMFPPRTPFFRKRFGAFGERVRECAEDEQRGNPPVSSIAPSPGHPRKACG